MEDYNPEMEQPTTEPQGEDVETTNNLFTIPPLSERDPESVEDDSISGWMLYMYVCIGLGAFLGLLSLKEPGVTPIIRYGVWINLAFAAYTIMAAYKRMRNAVFLAKTYVWVSLLTNAFLVLRGALVTPVGSGLNTYTALSAVISAAWLYFLYKSSAIEARFPRNMRRAFVWDWLAILVAFVIPFVTIAVQSYRSTDTIEYAEKTPDAKAVKKLKSEIAKLKKQCPTSMGSMDIVSIDYNEDNNIVLMRMNTASPVKNTKRYNELGKEKTMLALMDPEAKNMVRTFAAARASLRIILTSLSTGHHTKINFSPDDFESLANTVIDQRELAVRTIKTIADMENEGCPCEIAPNTTALSERIDGNMLVMVFKYDVNYVPENKLAWDYMRGECKKMERKRETLNGFLSDQMFVPLANYLKSADYGLRLIFTSENGKYTATMEISPEEFKTLYESILREK